MSRDLKAPDHTTLSRRNQMVVVPPLTRAHDGPIDLIVDSTGLKILGRGEWNAHKHKTSKKRRDWRKLHIGVDAEGFMVAAELTASSRDDASTLPDLLAPLEVPIRRFTADGTYDHRSVYDRASAAGTENVVIVIPPRRSALSAGPTDGPWAQREASLQRIRKVGRREWQKESGYRQQARVENSFFRYKSVFGGDLKARHSKAQRREAAIGCHILNRMAELGRPSSYPLGGTVKLSRILGFWRRNRSALELRINNLGSVQGAEQVLKSVNLTVPFWLMPSALRASAMIRPNVLKCPMPHWRSAD